LQGQRALAAEKINVGALPHRGLVKAPVQGLPGSGKPCRGKAARMRKTQRQND
jgi:hypothetical protein